MARAAMRSCEVHKNKHCGRAPPRKAESAWTPPAETDVSPLLRPDSGGGAHQILRRGESSATRDRLVYLRASPLTDLLRPRSRLRNLRLGR